MLSGLRGIFIGSWGDRGLQVNLSRSELVAQRGLHFQAPPHSEAKLVRCLKGGVGCGSGSSGEIRNVWLLASR